MYARGRSSDNTVSDDDRLIPHLQCQYTICVTEYSGRIINSPSTWLIWGALYQAQRHVIPVIPLYFRSVNALPT